MPWLANEVAKRVPAEKCELEGPYECPHCQGHFMVDVTFLDQVTLDVNCPYCNNAIAIPETEGEPAHEP